MSLLPPCHSPSCFPVDLAEINLWGWASLVQDVVGSLQALPPGLSHGLGPHVVALLQLLEVAMGVGFCHHCCHLLPHCRCVGAPQLAPPCRGVRLWNRLRDMG